MNVRSTVHSNLKRRIRQLKKLEITIRFCGAANHGRQLVWDAFFDLNDTPRSEAKHSLSELAAMSKEEYKRVIDEYFAQVYYEFYKENGIADENLYDPSLLAQLGLPATSDDVAIKKRFRELAKKYHPDAGGSSGKFIELMETYKKLMG